jgi:hypothetical protein
LRRHYRLARDLVNGCLCGKGYGQAIGGQSWVVPQNYSQKFSADMPRLFFYCQIILKYLEYNFCFEMFKFVDR